jgi:Zn-dependent protease
MSKKWKQRLFSIGFVGIFAVFGAFAGYYLAPYIENFTFLEIIYTILIFAASVPLHVILHELGHVLGGLASGYDFIMFRLFNTVWIKTEAGLSKRKEYIPGVMGQGLMIPPPTEKDEQPPFFLYHASGILMNVFTGFLFMFLGRTISSPLLAQFFNDSLLVAFFFAITNALPFKGTDGYNILQYFKRDEALGEITNLLYMYRDMVQGASLESLQKYVDLDAFASFENPNAATIYTLHADYLMDIKDFTGALSVYRTLYEHLDELFEGHKTTVLLNYLFTLILVEPSHPDVKKITQGKTYKEYQKIKQANYLRIYAAKALYVDEDFKKAETLLDEGEQYIALSPTVTDEKFEETMYAYLRSNLK